VTALRNGMTKEDWATYQREWHLRRRYGIDADEYTRLLEAQGEVCAICGGSNPSGHRLAVDHCHARGVVRGLLCHSCNSGLGKLRDDPDLLRLAIAYLEAKP
jgi:hypothetical protein